MTFAIFIWVMVVLMAIAFLFSYLVWSPPTKSPKAIAAEIMHLTTQIFARIAWFSLILWSTFLAFWLAHLLGAL